MSYTESNAECDECGDNIDDSEECYCSRCFDNHVAEIKCDKCSEHIEDPADSAVYCDVCWSKHTTPLHEQLNNTVSELKKTMDIVQSQMGAATSGQTTTQRALDSAYVQMERLIKEFTDFKAKVNPEQK